MIGFDLIYGLAKDIKNYLTWDEEVKVVDREWLKKSGFEKNLEEQGYKLYWSAPDKVESRKLDGYDVMFEVDKIKRVRCRIEKGRDKLVLLGKKST